MYAHVPLVPLDIDNNIQNFIKKRYFKAGKNKKEPEVSKNAEEFGFTQIRVSGFANDGAANFGMEFGGNNVINVDNLMPCTDKDSRDMEYMRGVFAFIETQSAIIDTTKVFTEG